jgi:hypothetical protein
MNNRIGKLVLLVLIVFTTTACTSKLAYKKDIDDPTCPADKELVFSLRSSTILISPAGNEKKPSDGKPAADQADAISPSNTCTKAEGNSSTSNDVLNKCLVGVNAKAAAARDKSVVYVAKPNCGTTIQSTSVDTDPFMVKSIVVNYKNPAIGIVSSAGAGAVAGFGVGGPWGAAIGGVVATAGQEMTFTDIKELYTKAAKANIPKPPWYKDVCEEDKKIDISRFEKFSNKIPELYLPVTLDFESGKKSIKPCWHPLPNRSPAAIKKAMDDPQSPELLSGWFYRIIMPSKSDKNSDKSVLPPVLPVDLKPGDKLISSISFQERDVFFSNTDNQEKFPVSACRSIELQITWWDLQNNAEFNDPLWYGYQMTVADPDYVQVVRIPKNGTVYLLPVCGGYESPTQSSSSWGDLIDAVVKQTQAVKEAQDKYNKK